MNADDMIRRMDAVQACQVGPSDEWSRATKDGYNQAATDCVRNILGIERTLPAVKPRVKPLEWHECNKRKQATHRAVGLVQEYSVGYDTESGFYAYSETLGMYLANTSTMDAAKAAAQADYEAQILAALKGDSHE